MRFQRRNKQSIGALTWFSVLILAILCTRTSATGVDDLNGVANEPTCNMTAYESWKAQQYLGTLAKNPAFWRYGVTGSFTLNNGLAIELVVADCTAQFNNLQTFLAGRTGPVTIQYAYKAMCSQYCLEADALSQQALRATGCSCMELSTQPSSPFFTEEGDWCQHNSARLLCSILGYCGVWDCRIDNFMCPRFEWNKRDIDLKGSGTCARGAAAPSFTLNRALLVGSSALAAALLWVMM